MREILSGLCLLLASALAQAQDSQANWHVYGAGTLKCGNWKAAREEKSAQVELIKQWVAGWVVTYNYYLSEQGGKGRVETPDFETITAYLDRYCGERPLSIIAFGAAELVQDLGGAKAFHNRPQSTKR